MSITIRYAAQWYAPGQDKWRTIFIDGDKLTVPTVEEAADAAHRCHRDTDATVRVVEVKTERTITTTVVG